MTAPARVIISHPVLKLFVSATGHFELAYDVGAVAIIANPPAGASMAYGERLDVTQLQDLAAAVLMALAGRPTPDRQLVLRDLVVAVVRWQTGDCTLGDVVQIFERLGMFGTLAAETVQ